LLGISWKVSFAADANSGQANRRNALGPEILAQEVTTSEAEREYMMA
jgi:hypothetical protein